MDQIFNYNNFREFLKDFYEVQKKARTGFTYARFSQQAGLGSPNYYKLVMDGEKNLTLENTIKFANALGLKDQEKDYFEALVQLNQAKSGTEKEYFFEKIKRLKNQKDGQLSKRVLEEYEFEALSSWIYHAVLLMTNLADFRESPRWISKKLYGLVSESEVASILSRLETTGLLKRDENGRLVQTNKRIKTREDLKRQSAQVFYEGLMARAAKSVSVDAPEEREFGAYLVGVHSKQLPELKKKVREFLSDLNEWALQHQDPERIYAMTFAGFPLTVEGEDKKWWS